MIFLSTNDLCGAFDPVTEVENIDETIRGFHVNWIAELNDLRTVYQCVCECVFTCMHTSNELFPLVSEVSFVCTSRIVKAKILHPVTATSQAQGRNLLWNSCKRRPCDILLQYPMTLSNIKLLDIFWRFASCECDCRIKCDALFAFNIYPRIPVNALLHRVWHKLNKKNSVAHFIAFIYSLCDKYISFICFRKTLMYHCIVAFQLFKDCCCLEIQNA